MLRIAEAREARGWTQEQLAQAIGTTQQTIQRWESGLVDPKSSRVSDISKALGITVSFLMGVDENGKESAPPTLVPDEQQLVDLYRAMTPQYRAMLVKTAALYAADSEKEADVPRATRTA